MLDTFEILTTSGVVLWSRSYASVNPSVINNFIADVFIEEKSAGAGGVKDSASAANTTPYRSDQHTLKWAFVKELGIIFVVSLPGKGDVSATGADFRRLSTGPCSICLGSTSWWTISRRYL